jgi:Asp-tRNA(Asn)/Glu-tRNA(Gln) amidotransferase A subunit family amidase
LNSLVAGQPQTLPGFEVLERDISQLQAAMASGTTTAKQITAAYLARIAAYDDDGPEVNAMTAVNARALEAAEALDQERAARGPRGPLHGIPVVIKDNFETIDMPTTGGSLALAGFQTGRDAFQVKKLRDAGAVIIGKTNLHELAHGTTTISSLGGQTRNPYVLTRNPGGSSGGTGAAVAANFAAAGMGTDTCGSIRIPAANNNLFGIRGTSGLSSRTGIIPLSHTQDIGGPLAKTVTDLAILLDATVGTDPSDPTTKESSGRVPKSYLAGLKRDALKGARIGILASLFGSAPEDREVGTIVRAAIKEMQKSGAEIVELAVPGLAEMLPGASLIDAEFKFDLIDYLAQFPSAPVHSLADILARGEYHAALEENFRRRNAVDARESDASRRAHVRRRAIRDLTVAVLDEQGLDAVVYPSLRRKAAIIGEPGGPLNCQLSATSGLPALAAPAGFTDDGVPVGLELLGRAWSEPQLLALAYAYEQATRPRRHPPTTPALVKGRGPTAASFASTVGAVNASLTLDTWGGLAFTLTGVRGAAGADEAIVIQRAAQDGPGPVIAILWTPGAKTTGEVRLAPRDLEALKAGRLNLVVRAGGAAGTSRAPIR